jgi:hypothetical protein
VFGDSTVKLFDGGNGEISPPFCMPHVVPSSNEHENLSDDVLESRDVAGYKHETIEMSSTANDDPRSSLLSIRKRRVYVPTGRFIVAQVLKENNSHLLSSSIISKVIVETS